LTLEKDRQLSELLELMIGDDETVTARAVVRRSDGIFKHPSDLTRRPERRTLLESAQQRQATLRRAAEKLGKSGKIDVAARLAAAEAEIDRLKQEKVILVAAVRAAILAIGRLGGMKAWREYFPAYSAAFEALREMDAVPAAEPMPMRAREVDRSQRGRKRS
jgi:hypothetical protein